MKFGGRQQEREGHGQEQGDGSMPTRVQDCTAFAEKASIRDLLRLRCRAECLRRMSKKRRALYEGIRERREAMKPLDFNIVEALREMRDNG
jgi:hypothetical protein